MLPRCAAVALALVVAPPAFGQWPNEVVRSDCNGNPSGLAFDPQNRAVVLCLAYECGPIPAHLTWSRRSAEGVWEEKTINTDPFRGPRNSASLALTADGSPYAQYFGTEWEYIVEVFVDLTGQPYGPGDITMFMGLSHDCSMRPSGLLAADPSYPAVHRLVMGSVCGCWGRGYAINGVTIVGQGFDLPFPTGPIPVIMKALDAAVGTDGVVNTVYKYYDCAVSHGLFYGNGTVGYQVMISAGDSNGHASIAVDQVSGRLHVASWNSNALHHFQSDDHGLTWSGPTFVDYPLAFGGGVSVEVAPNGNPVIAYWNVNERELRLAVRDAGGAWSHQTVANTVASSCQDGTQVSRLAFDRTYHPNVFYYDATDSTYRLATGPCMGPVPISAAGFDQAQPEGMLVTLDGSASSVSCGTPTYAWTQVAGTSVTLNLADPARPTFTAPPVGFGGETLTFQLVVGDGGQSGEPDAVNVRVTKKSRRR